MSVLIKSGFRLVPVLALAVSLLLLHTGVARAQTYSFTEDFESYEVGTNPTNVYDYWDGVAYTWGDDPAPLPDSYRVGLLGGNQVLNFYKPAPNVHLPFASKLYKQTFPVCVEGEATFYKESPASTMGWNGILFAWQDPDHFYKAWTSWDNNLYLMEAGTIIGQTALWPDKHVLEVDHKIQVRRVGNDLIATVTRLDTLDQKSVQVTNSDLLGGKIGFGFMEDVVPTPVDVDVDDFSAVGADTIPGAGVRHSVTTTSGVRLDFSNMTGLGDSAAVATSSPTPPAGRTLVSGTCFDVSTNVSFTGNVTVTVPYDPADLQGSGASTLRLYHYSGGAWRDITTSVDTVNHTVSGDTDSFSPFAIFEGAGSGGGPVSSVPASSEWSLALLALGGVGLLVLRGFRTVLPE